MSRKSAVVLLVMISVAVCGSAGAQSKPAKIEAPPPQPDVQHDTQSATPGAAHSQLAKLVGEYTTVSKLSIQPGATPAESSGTAKLWMTLDGRFLVEENTANFMGQTTQGFKMTGYNNASKRYEGVWMYTMSTSIMSLDGVSKDGGKTINFEGTYNDLGGKQGLEITVRHTDADHFVVELSGKNPDGSKAATLITHYTRKK